MSINFLNRLKKSFSQEFTTYFSVKLFDSFLFLFFNSSQFLLNFYLIKSSHHLTIINIYRIQKEIRDTKKNWKMRNLEGTTGDTILKSLIAAKKNLSIFPLPKKTLFLRNLWLFQLSEIKVWHNVYLLRVTSSPMADADQFWLRRRVHNSHVL